ncbi:glucose-1-phosphate cytidylyltransferase [Formosa agariphila KMM 3901]|uniref:Glucose-1-phosphate cytidylyltransferase n=1 Tax=Formosa agariphila (strain DSM 15362 / KCTC 12365 / LMG 23005 / KMM 3901 / M-2Alg 35-1) TaxID=1347342 RepID=T2KM86_FORAG|nr:glucose-1-phosphate cytidylyltransferase [Formosa agariphila]CDF80007.1 glucose-1-phosphate cytidylyltransferase [Formosa agariphila KMM 3901]
MKVLLLAGGLGTRISEETHLKPKPMVEIGGRPILWHIMKMYSHYGFNDFVVLLGYKGYVIKEFFANYFLHQSDITVDLEENKITIHDNKSEPWKITLLDTGMHSMTGGRVLRARKYIGDEPFMLTYGDGVSDVNIKELAEYHKSHSGCITMTSVQPDGRFGALKMDGDRISEFLEKPKGDGGWINGGFFVCDPKVLDYLDGDATVFEKEPLERMAEDKELYAFKHTGFWKPMDTLRDKNQLEEMLANNKAKWKTW